MSASAPGGIPMESGGRVRLVTGDLLEQETDAIVNSWNRNTIPWWLLLPQGVGGAIKRRAGLLPFKELARLGRLDLGAAVLTSAGDLPFKGIIHVAGINDAWRASEFSIRASVANALAVAVENGYRSIAMPVIGAGSGGFDVEKAEAIILDELGKLNPSIDVIVVRFGGRR